MKRCDDCGFEAKSASGLMAHRRAKHPADGGQVGPNAAAVETTIGELRRAGRLELIDEARVQALRSVAAALDANPFNSQMWREYREALEALTADDDDSGAADALIERLRSSVRNTSED